MFWCFLCFAIVLCFLKTWRSTDTRRLCFRHWCFKSDFAWCLVLISSPENVIWLWKKNWQNWPKIKCTPLCISLFHIKIVARAIYTYLLFSSTYTLLFCWKTKLLKCCFPQQIRLKTNIYWCILCDYSSVRIDFNMINKCHIPYSIVYTVI